MSTLKLLQRYRDEQTLVSITRDQCEEGSIQVFVLYCSNTLALLHHVYDFHIDGLYLVRIQDITKIESTSTDVFHKQLLIEEGEFDKVEFGIRTPIHSYEAFLRSLPSDEIVILEDEIADETEFLIGTVISANDHEASIRFFTGEAKWEEESSTIEIDRITLCQTKSNYTNVYSRHFDRFNKW